MEWLYFLVSRGRDCGAVRNQVPMWHIGTRVEVWHMGTRAKK